MDEAIAQKKKVRLGYLHYGLDKKQHETKTYTLSPYEMVYMNERYYLICVPDHAPNTRLYRIDRMKDIQILDDPRSEAVARQEAQNAVYAYVGAPERIIMYCDRAILDDVIDRFGTEVQIREHDENTFYRQFYRTAARRQILGTAIPTVCRGRRTRVATAENHRKPRKEQVSQIGIT